MTHNIVTFFSVIMIFSAVAVDIPHRYYFVSVNKTWNDAQSYCRQNHTDLATINNMQEMEILGLTLNGRPGIVAWIGLHKGNNKRWQWSMADGTLYIPQQSYQEWNSKEPNNLGRQEFCVAMYKLEKNNAFSGKWLDDDCSHKFTIVCEDGRLCLKHKSSSGEASRECKKNVATSKYIFINEKRTWHEAQRECRMNNTDLASVRNKNENEEIMKLTEISTSERVWIGLFNDSWQWSDLSNSSFRYWRPGQLDNSNQNNNCATVDINEQNRRWNDDNCANTRPFICHKNKLILINQNLTWKESLRYCRQNYVDLVSVDSEETQSWVIEVTQSATTLHVWLGLRHTCTLGLWYWVSGESVCYNNWAPGNGIDEGNCRPVERTGAVQSGGGQQWVSLAETQTLNFICTTYED